MFEFVLDDCILEHRGRFRLADGEQIEEENTEEHEAAEPIESNRRDARQRLHPSAPRRPEEALERPRQTRKPPASIRVDLDRIDRLVNMVGELVITQAMLSEQISQLSVKERASLLHGVETLALQMRELQDNVMSIRAQPVKSVFSRMTRLVRELSCSLNKEAKAGYHRRDDRGRQDGDRGAVRSIDAYDSQFDGSRSGNAGRTRKGWQADEREQSSFRQSNRSGKIVISVSDDGRGINREKVLKKAIEKGLISADARPSDDEIDNVILSAGILDCGSGLQRVWPWRRHGCCR